MEGIIVSAGSALALVGVFTIIWQFARRCLGARSPVTLRASAVCWSNYLCTLSTLDSPNVGSPTLPPRLTLQIRCPAANACSTDCIALFVKYFTQLKRI
jgi:hypothetical protein